MAEESNGVIILITLLNILVYKLQKLQEAKLSEQTNHLSSLQHLCRRFSLRDIHWATFNFHDDNIIGQGGFGKVYKGIIDFGENTVAIKRLKPMSRQGSKEFQTEIEMLSRFRHSNVVSLIGYCDDGLEMILVYEYMACGTLADHLHKKIKKGDTSLLPLSWVQRLKICIGAARGLEYLHTGTSIQNRVIHRDVKSTNILLDENLSAKISDFGLSKVGPANQTSTYVSTHVKGTPGYIDPYYFATHRLTRKSDVYGFGVVLFEVLCARPAVDSSVDEEQRGLAGWAQHCFQEGLLDQIIDPRIMGKIAPSSLIAFVNVAIQCLHNGPKNRPSIAEVVVGLESALSLQEESTVYVLVERPITNHNQENTDTNSSTVEGQTSNRNQEKLDSSVVAPKNANGADGGIHNEQSTWKSARIKLRKNIGHFLSFTAWAFSVHSDTKASTKIGSNNEKSKLSEMKVKDEGLVPEVRVNLKIFTFAELERATNKFGTDMVLGEGGFGKVYKGWINESTYAPSRFGVGIAVAVKRFNSASAQGFEEWQKEVTVLGRYIHPNLVKLLGYCSTKSEYLLVYEYMPGKSLDIHLFGDKRVADPLPWVVRLKIMIGAARCIAFLHTAEEQLILRDPKTSNILLDEEYNAKLSDLGLSRSGPVNDDTHISTRVMGTYGYAAPEYIATGHLSAKADVYTFGVVILEVLTGMRVIDLSRDHKKRNLVEWAKPFLRNKRKAKSIVDPSLKQDFDDGEMLSTISSLILQCLSPLPKTRPSMVQVLETLEKLTTAGG